MSDLEVLLDFNKKFKGWEGSVKEPYDREADFVLKPTIKFPEAKGIYMFKSELSGIYQIGQTKQTLHDRLKGKLNEDLKEIRVKNYRDESGKLIHDYPMLPIYDEECSIIYYLSTDRYFNPMNAERILLSTYYLSNGKLPSGNRTGIPSFAKLNDTKALETFHELTNNFGLKENKN